MPFPSGILRIVCLEYIVGKKPEADNRDSGTAINGRVGGKPAVELPAAEAA